MVRIKSLLLILSAIPLFCFSQALDEAQYECRYKFHYINLSLEEMQEDDMILLIGNKVSKFYSYHTFYSDSLNRTPEGRKVWKELFRTGAATNNFPYRRTPEFIYKNYPAGKITVTDNVQLDYFKYTEDYQPQEWQFTDSVMEILGYPCQQATCMFRGRTYYAWFTAEIPLSDGPWKFTGLPGLILKVEDSEHLYCFEIEGFRQIFNTPVLLEPARNGIYMKIERNELLKLKRKNLEDNFGYINATTGIDFSEYAEKDTRKTMKYDFMEKDYNE
ncbi:MAG: GLPGLI family protein [Tannerella sp.]|jgi:GLPGLI family protein|nr:GLPGLI family protein [Tannerella sp.]